MRNNGWSSMITGIAIGIGVGAAMGILFAPQSGEETRDYLLGTAEDKLNDTRKHFSKVAQRVRKSGKDFVQQAQASVENAGEDLKDLADAGRRAYSEAAQA